MFENLKKHDFGSPIGETFRDAVEKLVEKKILNFKFFVECILSIGKLPGPVQYD